MWLNLSRFFHTPLNTIHSLPYPPPCTTPNTPLYHFHVLCTQLPGLDYKLDEVGKAAEALVEHLVVLGIWILRFHHLFFESTLTISHASVRGKREGYWEGGVTGELQLSGWRSGRKLLQSYWDTTARDEAEIRYGNVTLTLYIAHGWPKRAAWKQVTGHNFFTIIQLRFSVWLIYHYRNSIYNMTNNKEDCITIINNPNIWNMCIQNISGDKDGSGALKRICAACSVSV